MQTSAKPVSKQSSNILKMFFEDEGLELINLPRFLNHLSFSSFIYMEFRNFETPSVIYTIENSFSQNFSILKTFFETCI